jgi:hypothetical protein
MNTNKRRKSRAKARRRGGYAIQNASDCEGWDLLRRMQLLRDVPLVLAGALADMGITENGDESLADWEKN